MDDTLNPLAPRGVAAAWDWLLRSLGGIRGALRVLPIVLIVFYLASTLFNVLAWNQQDLNHTVGSSYAYLFGHPLSFYDYNAKFFGGNDYFPTIYILFAAWMAPVKLLVSPGVQNVKDISGWELGWARIGLVLAFWATAYLVHLIAKELFPDRPGAQTTARVAFLLSPIAVWAFNLQGQYDIIGVFFTCLGFLYWLRGDRWRFALFFSLAISCKYFALLIFIPLLVLQFKRIREIVPLFLVGLSVPLVEIAIYFHNTAFRDHTLFSLVDGKVQGAETQTIAYLFIIVLVGGTIALWRYRPSSPGQMQFIAVQSVLVIFGLMFASVVWHPQWYIILTPWMALSVAYLKRPLWFLIWESVSTVVFLWCVVNSWRGSLDSTMIENGVLHRFFPGPKLLLSDFIYPPSGLHAISVLLLAYYLSPLAFACIEWALRVQPAASTTPPTWAWWMRALTIPLAWTLPVLFAVYVPVGVATRIQPAAAVANHPSYAVCAAADTPYGEMVDGTTASASFHSRTTRMTGLSVLVATYGRAAKGELSLELKAPDGRTLATGTADLAHARDNNPVYFIFPTPLKLSRGDVYTAMLTTHGNAPGSGIALWGTAADCNPRAGASFNGHPAAGDFDISYYG